MELVSRTVKTQNNLAGFPVMASIWMSRVMLRAYRRGGTRRVRSRELIVSVSMVFLCLWLYHAISLDMLIMLVWLQV